MPADLKQPAFLLDRDRFVPAREQMANPLVSRVSCMTDCAIPGLQALAGCGLSSSALTMRIPAA